MRFGLHAGKGYYDFDEDCRDDFERSQCVYLGRSFLYDEIVEDEQDVDDSEMDDV